MKWAGDVVVEKTRQMQMPADMWPPTLSAPGPASHMPVVAWLTKPKDHRNRDTPYEAQRGQMR